MEQPEKYVFDKLTLGWELIGQVVIYARSWEEAKVKAKQIHGPKFLFTLV